MKKEIHGVPQVIATGGLAAIIAQETDSIDIVDEFLTLEGLHLIYEMNRG
jgi:type III pantothenate kinase